MSFGSFLKGLVSAIAPALGIIGMGFGASAVASGLGATVAGGEIASSALGGEALASSEAAGLTGGAASTGSLGVGMDLGSGLAQAGGVLGDAGGAVAGGVGAGAGLAEGLSTAGTMASSLSNVFNVAGAGSGSASGGFSLSDIWSQVKSISPAINTAAKGLQGATDLYSIYQGNQISKQAQQLGAQADPMGPYRAGYAQQLQQLQANPGDVSKIPGYQAGLTAVQRTLAAQGLTGSGNAMASLQQYGGNFYNQELARLAGLAGGTPGAGAQTQLAGQATALKTTTSAVGDLSKLFQS